LLKSDAKVNKNLFTPNKKKEKINEF
jgi:hypothetical protein